MGKKGAPGVKKKESMFRTPEGVHGRGMFYHSGFCSSFGVCCLIRWLRY